MPWKLKLYENSSAAFAAAEEDLAIGAGWRDSAGNLTLQTPGGLGRIELAKGWTITGEGEQLTVAPSILVSGSEGPLYHGFLQNGILTDDCDGRTFPQFPSTA